MSSAIEQTLQRMQQRRQAESGRHGSGHPPALPIGVFEARITAVHDNYCEASLWAGGQLVGNTINVAKYPEVRVSEWNGKTWNDPIDGTVWSFTRTGAQQRDVSDGTTTVSQVIVPRYLTADDGPTGSLILCAPLRVEVDPDTAGDAVVCQVVEISPRWFGEAS